MTNSKSQNYSQYTGVNKSLKIKILKSRSWNPQTLVITLDITEQTTDKNACAWC